MSFSNTGPNDNDWFRSIDKKMVSERIAFLERKFPNTSTRRNYQISTDMIDGVHQDMDRLQDKLQAVANFFLHHLRLMKTEKAAPPIKILTVAPSTTDAGVYLNKGGRKCILINNDMHMHNLRQKIAIVAHEISHYYLDTKHLGKKLSTRENELLTELNAIYCGFGFILLEGYSENAYIESVTLTLSSRVGYVVQKTIYESIIQTAYVRRQNPHWIVKNMPYRYKALTYMRLLGLFQQYRNHKRQTAGSAN